MGNSLRCCLACVLPFGSLDLIRIVHLNGQIEEITHPITAGEVLGNNPNHVLTKPAAADQGMVRRILILSPSSELKRGTIYFLIPASSLPQHHQKKKHAAAAATGLKSRNKKEMSRHNDDSNNNSNNNDDGSWPEKKRPSPSQRHRRSGRVVGEWRPHLASISEN